MRLYIISLLLFICCFKGFCQQEAFKYSCSCNKIGLDSAWADSNKVSCYLLPVERNYVKPRNKNYFIAVAIAPALSTTPKEPLLYLHGGPGIATLSNFPRYLRSVTFSRLRKDHDLIFFDYRGTGFSEPSLCKSLTDSLHAIPNTVSNDELISRETTAYSNCKKDLLRQGILLSDFSSLQSAADAEAIRKQMGIKDWDIYSVSHGTTVALNMMRSFPKHIHSVILDSPFPPNVPWSDFVHPFDTCFKVLEKKIKNDSVYAEQFPSIRKDFVKIINRLKKAPFAMPIPNGNGTSIHANSFNDGDFAWSVWTAMLNPESIRLIPLALKEIAAGNDSVLLYWALAFNDPNAFGEFSSAQSRAILGFESKPRYEEETENYLMNKFPEFTSFIIPGLDDALNKVYRPEIPAKEYFDAVKSDIPTLIFSGEYDPVCPPLFANITSKTLHNSTVIIVPSASHAAMYADDCTKAIGAAFYLNSKIKPTDECLLKRKQIEFVTSDILTLLK